jgi:hypothetical protein
LVVPPGNDTASNAREAVSTGLLSGQIFPRRNDIALWVLLSMPALVLVVIGLKRGGPDHRKTHLWAFALPCLSFVVYRNAFPYFFPFIAPPLMVLAAAGAYRWRQDRRLAFQSARC